MSCAIRQAKSRCLAKSFNRAAVPLAWGIASEWSPQFAGYVAGAVEAAELGVRTLAARLPKPRSELTE